MGGGVQVREHLGAAVEEHRPARQGRERGRADEALRVGRLHDLDVVAGADEHPHELARLVRRDPTAHADQDHGRSVAGTWVGRNLEPGGPLCPARRWGGPSGWPAEAAIGQEVEPASDRSVPTLASRCSAAFAGSGSNWRSPKRPIGESDRAPDRFNLGRSRGRHSMRGFWALGRRRSRRPIGDSTRIGISTLGKCRRPGHPSMRCSAFGLESAIRGRWPIGAPAQRQLESRRPRSTPDALATLRAPPVTPALRHSPHGCSNALQGPGDVGEAAGVRDLRGPDAGADGVGAADAWGDGVAVPGACVAGVSDPAGWA